MISHSLDNFLINFSFVSILITTLFFWIQFSFGAQKEIQFLHLPLTLRVQGQVPNFLVIFCSILILLNFINRWISTNHFPLSNLYESLLFLTLALLLFLIYFQFTLKKIFVGVLILPIVLFINTFATFTLPFEMQQPTSLVPALQSNWLMMHVTIMMLSYAALIFGSLLAITFLIVRYILKDKIKNLNIQNEAVDQTRTLCVHVQGRPQVEVGEHKMVANLPHLNPLGGAGAAAGRLKQPNFGGSVHKAAPGFSSPARGSRGEQPNRDPQLKQPPDPLAGLLKPGAALAEGLLKANTSHLKGASVEHTSGCFESGGLPKGCGVEGRSTGSPKGQATTILENQYSTFRLIRNIDIIYDLDNLSYRVLTFGFPLLTIGILSGSVWANETWGSYWNWDPKETWALITWFVYAIYLHSRIIKGWSGTKPALIATFGFVTVWICYLGVNVFAKGLHSYGWFFTN